MSEYSDTLKEKLKESIFSALSEEEITAEEVIDTIKEEIASLIEYHKNNLTKMQKAYDLITSYGSYFSIDTAYSGPSFSTDSSNVIHFNQYTDDILNAMCDAAQKEEEQRKAKKWTVQLEVDGPSGEYFLTFPDDLLDTVGWEENDELEWIERKDGSFELRKVEK